MVTTAVTRWGRLDCAVNNAAYNASFALLADTRDEGWDKTVDATLKSVFLCLRAEIKAMQSSGGGAIVNISSLAGLKGEPLQSPYSAAKAGVLGLTYTAASEYAQCGIRVNAICPGGVATPGIERYFKNTPEGRTQLENTHAMRRLGRPEEIADAAAYLCSDRSSFITGHALPVDGGLRINNYLM
jgi:NAD(P)-dependent dehydrogenase (short-subunit alcohol dehydrogenase family)